MLTIRDAFLAAICAEPDDDAVRLIFADWLDEHGEPERAEFIRVQCELAHWFDPYEYAPQAEPLRRREQELILLGKLTDLSPIQGPATYIFRRGFVHRVRCPCAAWLEHGPAIVRSQPIERVELSDRKPAWLVRPGFPVGWLRQLDFPSGQRREDELPDALFDRLKDGPRCRYLNPNWFGCDDLAVALDALSAACLALARQPLRPANRPLGIVR